MRNHTATGLHASRRTLSKDLAHALLRANIADQACSHLTRNAEKIYGSHSPQSVTLRQIARSAEAITADLDAFAHLNILTKSAAK